MQKFQVLPEHPTVAVWHTCSVKTFSETSDNPRQNNRDVWRPTPHRVIRPTESSGLGLLGKRSRQ